MSKELIDFMAYVYKNWQLIERTYPEPDVLVETYLKSIDSAQGENSNVSDNETKEKKCNLIGWCYFQPGSDDSKGCKTCENWYF